jgi:hypothetical protein
MTYSVQAALDAIKVISVSIAGLLPQTPNFKFYVVLSAGDLGFDDWGNPISDENLKITLTGRLSQVKPTTTVPNPGVEANAIYYEGRLTDDSKFPNPLPTKVGAQILSEGLWRKGTFYPVQTFQSAFSESIAASSALGQKVAGYFQLGEGY